MSEIDYEELIRSPLDDQDGEPISPWWAALGGVVVGVLAGYLILLVTNGAAATTTITELVTTTTTTAPLETVATDYPAGYMEIAPDLSARIEEVIVGPDVITVAFTTATIRGVDPADVSWPRGGSWLLTSTGGSTVESTRVLFGGFSPAAFSVQFPAEPLNGATEFESVRLVERLDTERFSGSASLPFTGEPFTIDEPLSIPVNQETTLVVTDLQVGRFQGLVEWEAVGAELGATVTAVVRLLDSDEAEVGSYAAFPQVRQPGSTGVIDVNWQRSFPIDQEGAVTVSVDYVVDVVEATPVSIDFPLEDVAVGR